jgi:uncharacterized protein YqeY
MNLKQKINNDYLNAFKAKDKITKNLLSVVKTEIQMKEKELMISDLNDVDIVKILNKISKSIKETIEKSKENEDLKKEFSIIENYLPKQMTEDEITLKVMELYESGFRNIGEFMKEFSNYQVDKKIVSKIVNNKLNK